MFIRLYNIKHTSFSQEISKQYEVNAYIIPTYLGSGKCSSNTNKSYGYVKITDVIQIMFQELSYVCIFYTREKFCFCFIFWWSGVWIDAMFELTSIINFSRLGLLSLKLHFVFSKFFPKKFYTRIVWTFITFLKIFQYFQRKTRTMK